MSMRNNHTRIWGGTLRTLPKEFLVHYNAQVEPELAWDGDEVHCPGKPGRVEVAIEQVQALLQRGGGVLREVVDVRADVPHEVEEDLQA